MDIVSLACILLPPFLGITASGTYDFCPGTYHSQVTIFADNVHIRCHDTTLVGPGLYLGGTWSQSIQIVDGWHTYENATIEGCTFENSTVAISGVEVDEDGVHNLLPDWGRLILRNNTFHTNYSVFWCSLSPGQVILEYNRGAQGIVMGSGSLTKKGNRFPVLRYDPTGYPQPQCPTTKAYKLVARPVKDANRQGSQEEIQADILR